MLPAIIFAALPLALAAAFKRASGDPLAFYNIHPNGNANKCVDLLGNTRQNGQPVQASRYHALVARRAESRPAADFRLQQQHGPELEHHEGPDQVRSRRHKLLSRRDPAKPTQRDQDEDLGVFRRLAATRLVLH
jgi:hypothetical protein